MKMNEFKNKTKIQETKAPDTCGRANSIWYTLRVDWEIF